MFQMVGKKTGVSRFETSPDLKLKMNKKRRYFVVMCVHVWTGYSIFFFIPQPAAQVQIGVIEYFVLLQDNIFWMVKKKKKKNWH